jgi:hypothetical protein
MYASEPTVATGAEIAAEAPARTWWVVKSDRYQEDLVESIGGLTTSGRPVYLYDIYDFATEKQNKEAEKYNYPWVLSSRPCRTAELNKPRRMHVGEI